MKYLLLMLAIVANTSMAAWVTTDYQSNFSDYKAVEVSTPIYSMDKTKAGFVSFICNNYARIPSMYITYNGLGGTEKSSTALIRIDENDTYIVVGSHDPYEQLYEVDTTFVSDIVEEMKAGNTLRIQLHLYRGKYGEYSLKGFTKAYTQLINKCEKL